MYPSCVACFMSQKPCKWVTCVVSLRMARLPNRTKSCESCRSKQVQCKLIWEQGDTLKRLADDSQEAPSSSRRAKDDLPASFLEALQNIDKNMGILVKHAAAQALKTDKDHAATSASLESIMAALSKLTVK